MLQHPLNARVIALLPPPSSLLLPCRLPGLQPAPTWPTPGRPAVEF